MPAPPPTEDQKAETPTKAMCRRKSGTRKLMVCSESKLQYFGIYWKKYGTFGPLWKKICGSNWRVCLLWEQTQLNRRADMLSLGIACCIIWKLLNETEKFPRGKRGGHLEPLLFDSRIIYTKSLPVKLTRSSSYINKYLFWRLWRFVPDGAFSI